MNIRFLNPAEGEMLEAAQFYEDQAVGLGDRFLDEVEGCVELLLDRPHIGRLVGEFRRFPLRKFPFTLIYTIEDNDLVVVAVSHQRRRPGYWMGRYDRQPRHPEEEE
jgi:plasmid stabilization system protein ParE